MFFCLVIPAHWLQPLRNSLCILLFTFPILCGTITHAVCRRRTKKPNNKNTEFIMPITQVVSVRLDAEELAHLKKGNITDTLRALIRDDMATEAEHKTRLIDTIVQALYRVGAFADAVDNIPTAHGDEYHHMQMQRLTSEFVSTERCALHNALAEAATLGRRI
jgi:hypothetical protein